MDGWMDGWSIICYRKRLRVSGDKLYYKISVASQASCHRHWIIASNSTSSINIGPNYFLFSAQSYSSDHVIIGEKVQQLETKSFDGLF
jgi:hypothetical protein